MCVCVFWTEKGSIRLVLNRKSGLWLPVSETKGTKTKETSNSIKKILLPFLAHSHAEVDCMVKWTLMIKTNYKLTYLFSVSLAWQICGCGTCGHPSFVSEKQEWRPALLTTSKSWVPFSKFTKQIMIKSQWTVLRPKDKVYTLLEAKSAHKQAYQPHISLSLKSSLNSTNRKTTYIQTWPFDFNHQDFLVQT